MAILKRIHILTLSLALSLFLTGCLQEFEPDVDTTPVLCVNSLILPGEPIEVKVTHSWMYSNSIRHNYTNAGQTVDNIVDDARTYIYVNGELKSEDYLPVEGDSIHIVVESAKYGKADASVKVPVAVPLSICDVVPRITDVWNDPDYAMKATLRFALWTHIEIGRTPSEMSYFQLNIDGYDYKDEKFYYELLGTGFLGPGCIDQFPYEMFHFAGLDSDQDPILKEYITVTDEAVGAGSLLAFSNRQFQGEGYGFNALFNGNYLSVWNDKYDPELFDCKVVFSLKTVSQSLFNHTLYEWVLEDGFVGQFEDTGLADPIWGYSNVSTGAGVVAACSESTCTISLRDFLEAAFKDAQPEWKE